MRSQELRIQKMTDGYGNELPAVIYDQRGMLIRVLPQAIFRYLTNSHMTLEELITQLEQEQRSPDF